MADDEPARILEGRVVGSDGHRGVHDKDLAAPAAWPAPRPATAHPAPGTKLIKAENLTHSTPLMLQLVLKLEILHRSHGDMLPKPGSIRGRIEISCRNGSSGYSWVREMGAGKLLVSSTGRIGLSWCGHFFQAPSCCPGMHLLRFAFCRISHPVHCLRVPGATLKAHLSVLEASGPEPLCMRDLALNPALVRVTTRDSVELALALYFCCPTRPAAQCGA